MDEGAPTFADTLKDQIVGYENRKMTERYFKNAMHESAKIIGYEGSFTEMEDDPAMLQKAVHLGRLYGAIMREVGAEAAMEAVETENAYINGDISFDEWQGVMKAYIDKGIFQDYGINLTASRKNLIENPDDTYTIEEALAAAVQPAQTYAQTLVQKAGLAASQGLKEPEAAALLGGTVYDAIQDGDFAGVIKYKGEPYTVQEGIGRAAQTQQTLDTLLGQKFSIN